MADSIDVIIEALVLFVGGVFLLAYPETFAKPDSSDYEKGRKRTISRTVGFAMVLGAIAFAGFQLSKLEAERKNQENSSYYR